MKTKVFWTDDQQAAVFAEAKNLRANHPDWQIKQICDVAQRILPEAQRKSLSSVGYRMAISKIVGPRNLTNLLTPPAKRRVDSARTLRQGVASDRHSAPNDLTLHGAVRLLVGVIVEEVRRQLNDGSLDRALAQPVVETALRLAPPETDDKNPDTWEDAKLVREIAAARAANNMVRWHRLVGVRRRRDKGGEFQETPEP